MRHSMPNSQGKVSYVASAPGTSAAEPIENKQDQLKLLLSFYLPLYCDSPSLKFMLGSTVAELKGKSRDDTELHSKLIQTSNTRPLSWHQVSEQESFCSG